MATRAGFIALLGVPNSGKSSLLNWLLEKKIVLTSRKSNSTRRKANIVITTKSAQMIFTDTPGLNKRDTLLDKFMLKQALSTLKDSYELILFISSIKSDLKSYEEFLQLDRRGIEHIVVLTKIDLASQQELLKKMSQYQDYKDKFLALLPTSIKYNQQKYFLDTIQAYMPIHPFYYDRKTITTQSKEEIYKELIREAIFDKTSQEVPYYSDVLINNIKETKNVEIIDALIVVSSNTQKGIMIGKDATSLIRISKKAEALIKNLSNKPPKLRISVRNIPKWNKKEEELKKFN